MPLGRLGKPAMRCLPIPQSRVAGGSKIVCNHPWDPLTRHGGLTIRPQAQGNCNLEPRDKLLYSRCGAARHIEKGLLCRLE